VHFDVEDRSRNVSSVSRQNTAASSLLSDVDGDIVEEFASYTGPHGAAVSGGARFAPTVLPSSRSVGLGAMQLTPQPRGALADLKPSPVVRGVAATASDDLGISTDLPLIDVRVEAVGLNFRDVLNVLNMYPGNPGPPGSDYAGVVIGGANEAGVASFPPGTEIFGLAPGCLGTQVTACALAAAPKPPGISFADAAGCPTIFVTVDLALAEAAPATGVAEAVLVHAATGGVGLAACQVLASRGMEVFATAGSARKRALLRALGLTNVAGSRSTEFLEVLLQTRGKPIDVVINSLTSSGMVSASLAALREGGGFAEISKRDIWSAQAAAADHPTVNYKLVATDFLSPQRLQVMLGRLSQSLHKGTIKPIACSQSGLIAVRECMREMSGGNHIGKVIVCVAPTPPGGALQVVHVEFSLLVPIA
jgi:NADPH:quinone reductase-like Zn-dependent oxidoreductase